VSNPEYLSAVSVPRQLAASASHSRTCIRGQGHLLSFEKGVKKMTTVGRLSSAGTPRVEPTEKLHIIPVSKLWDKREK